MRQKLIERLKSADEKKTVYKRELLQVSSQIIIKFMERRRNNTFCVLRKTVCNLNYIYICVFCAFGYVYRLHMVNKY